MTLRLRLLLIVPGALFLVALLAFEFGLRKGRDQAPRTLPNPPATSAPSSDEEVIRYLLAQDLTDRHFPFPAVVEAATGHRVLPADRPDEGLLAIKAAIETAAAECLLLFNGGDSPVRGLARINEASRYFEDALRSLISADPDLTCTVPDTADGRAQRSGYPDLRIAHAASGTVAYLDPKLFEQSGRDSTLRSFYYEPKENSGKVREDAAHFLLGFAHDGKDGAWTFTGWELVDLATLQVALKAEFQASNRDLYRNPPATQTP